MEKSILDLFREYPHLALLISLCISIVVAVLGVLPSVFITAANILFFGFWNGTFISFLGEAIGAGIAFILYRKGFKNKAQQGLQRYNKIKRLLYAEGREAFSLVFALRLIPFVPSGLVTFAAAIGKVSLLIFFTASSMGKLPALFIEAYAVYEVTAFGWQGKLILLAVAIGLVYYVLRKKNKNASVPK